MKIDPYYQRQKCRPMALVSGGINRIIKVYADIRGGSLVSGRQTIVGLSTTAFSAFSLAIFSTTLQMRPALLYSNTQSVIGFSVTPKCMTLNDLGWLAISR